jgi:hypothetical protein
MAAQQGHREVGNVIDVARFEQRTDVAMHEAPLRAQFADEAGARLAVEQPFVPEDLQSHVVATRGTRAIDDAHAAAERLEECELAELLRAVAVHHRTSRSMGRAGLRPRSLCRRSARSSCRNDVPK